MTLFTLGSTVVITRLIIAVALGMVLGAQRSLVHKTAGMRTYALIALGSAAFVLVGIQAIAQFGSIASIDPMRMASQVVVGIGFVGAGLIIFKDEKLNGLTTAVGLWVSAAIGIACGYGYYLIATAVTLLALLIFSSVFWAMEERIKEFPEEQVPPTSVTTKKAIRSK